jgi:hypothetical protein
VETRGTTREETAKRTAEAVSWRRRLKITKAQHFECERMDGYSNADGKRITINVRGLLARYSENVQRINYGHHVKEAVAVSSASWVATGTRWRIHTGDSSPQAQYLFILHRVEERDVTTTSVTEHFKLLLNSPLPTPKT